MAGINEIRQAWPEPSAIGMTWPQYRRRECRFNGRRVALTGAETSILSVLLIRRGQAVTRQELVEAVFPDPFNSPEWEDSNIVVHVGRLRNKLPGLIGFRYYFGYLIDQPPVDAFR